MKLTGKVQDRIAVILFILFIFNVLDSYLFQIFLLLAIVGVYILPYLYSKIICRFNVFKEKPGVISKESCWVMIDNHGYIYIHGTLLGLLKEVITEWKNDKHLVG